MKWDRWTLPYPTLGCLGSAVSCLPSFSPTCFLGGQGEPLRVPGGRLKPLPPKDTGLLLLPQPGPHVHTGAPSPAQCLESRI